MLQEAKVALVPGSAFGTEGEGYLRISYASSLEDLEEACERIRQALGKLSGGQKEAGSGGAADV